jgi:FAD/FMN-containing dehydrogenase
VNVVDEGLKRALTDLVGADGLVDDRRQLRLYRGGPWGAGDASGQFGVTPALAVRPADAAQVATCLRLLADEGCPTIALGGGTGLTGGQLPTADSIVVDLARLDRLEAIEVASRRARVGAAVRLGDLAAAAEREGLLFAHDPWSQAIASVGGAISTNGVGYLAAGYGTMGQQVLGLQVALTTGELLDLPTAPTTAAGPDLSRLFVGSEGTLGVITTATVRLFPQPERRTLVGYRFASFEEGFKALQDAAALRLPLAIVDYEEEDDGPGAELFVGVDGIPELVVGVMARLDALARQRGAEPMAQRAVDSFWRTRHESAEHYAHQLAEQRTALLAADEEPPLDGRRRSGWRYMHLALPAGEVVAFLRRARELAGRRRVRLRNAGIWGQPELFSFVLDGPGAATDAVADELIGAAAAMGGSIEYCHGVGLRLAHLMPLALGPAMPVLRRIKGALDPTGTLNPGKQGLVP